jgi:hypothetical protein
MLSRQATRIAAPFRLSKHVFKIECTVVDATEDASLLVQRLQLGKFGWVHEISCPSENTLSVAELLNWRVQKLILHPAQR